MSKSLLIISAGPGIGDATAQRFGKEGWHVILGAALRSVTRGFTDRERVSLKFSAFAEMPALSLPYPTKLLFPDE
jgi:NAD(P)-dependent dehydrogenase (short-subunit alcohol dehydrogenase family)